jgi:predicted transcriptional regulator
MLVEGIILIQDQLKILKFMSEVTGKMDMTEFASNVEMTPQEVLEKIHELTESGLLQKIGRGYAITEKGKALLKASASVPENMQFRFYDGIDNPTDVSANSGLDFYEKIKTVNDSSIEFHLNRGDFENWIRSAVDDQALADDVAKMKQSGLNGANLREEIVKTFETRYSI